MSHIIRVSQLIFSGLILGFLRSTILGSPSFVLQLLLNHLSNKFIFKFKVILKYFH